MKKYIITLVASLLMVQTTFAEGYQLLKPSGVLDVARGVLMESQQVLILDDKIVAIGSATQMNAEIPENYKVIDLEGLTLMPGLIDAHSHVLLHPYNETSWNDQVMKESRAERVARGVIHLKNTLDAGFTSLRDLGSEGAGYADVGLKQALEKGVIPGPSIIVAGRAIVATGSYGPKGFDLSHDIILGAEPADGNDLIRVVRDQIGKGADIIKFYADYRWGPNGEAKPTFSLQEMKTMVEVANSSGRQVVAHSATAEGMRRATLAGVQSIEHGDGGTIETFQLMKEHGVIFCPTVTITESIAEYGGWLKGQGPEPKSVATKKDAMTSALKSGVTICNGSDVGPYTHGDNLRELLIMHEYGLSIEKTLQAATIVGAELMNKKGELGEVKVGYIADLIAVKGNPLENLEVLSDIRMVMQGGEVYK
ncbi:MAG: amidohydrolase family protein [Kordiimonadaceae bacterium]|jgi:imidazolonepropionase-like amidohydrolase|nr:amidohydrolase family protein [Kordiimonadaceae bacterium]MBT6032720.1 amidohydrolase family protein [Kordiimonadaceae bacterium]